MALVRLGDLVGAAFGHNLPESARDRLIAGLTADSRAVENGFLFAALPGTRVDGAAFIPQALERGAVAVLTRPEGAVFEAPGAVLLVDRNPRRLFALLAARFYGAQPQIIAAVTGTNGKTSVAVFLRQIWERQGLSAASIGTLGVMAESVNFDFGLTTPDPVQLHRALAELKSAGIDHVAMEASSHGLTQYRLDGVKLAAAAITNLTRDHLDYHESFEDYAYAKLRLFGEVMAPGGVAVINADAEIGAEAEALSWARGHRVLTVGRRGRDVTLVDAVAREAGQEVHLRYENEHFDIVLPLVGAFQAANALVAAGLAIGLGARPEVVFESLAHLRGAPGRLELVARLPHGASVYVDYAHTPDALKTVLEALRPHVTGKLYVVFGCGGDRDREKRPEMGAIANRLADRVIITDDNPRSEDPAQIRTEILKGARGAQEIPDRAQAIREAVEALDQGDVLIIAGKGHETGQILGENVIPFNDAEEIRHVVASLGAAA